MGLPQPPRPRQHPGSQQPCCRHHCEPSGSTPARARHAPACGPSSLGSTGHARTCCKTEATTGQAPESEEWAVWREGGSTGLWLLKAALGGTRALTRRGRGGPEPGPLGSGTAGLDGAGAHPGTLGWSSGRGGTGGWGPPDVSSDEGSGERPGVGTAPKETGWFRRLGKAWGGGRQTSQCASGGLPGGDGRQSSGRAAGQGGGKEEEWRGARRAAQWRGTVLTGGCQEGPRGRVSGQEDTGVLADPEPLN